MLVRKRSVAASTHFAFGPMASDATSRSATRAKGAIFGAHLNPAVSLAFALLGDSP